MNLRILVFVGLVSCGVSRLPNHCDHLGTVHDLKGLDACRWIIEKGDGTRLLVANPEEHELKDGESVYFDYREVDGFSACMAEDQIILLTCFSPAGSNRCEDATLENTAWIQEMAREGAREIVRYHHDSTVFRVSSSTGISWHHCDGSLASAPAQEKRMGEATIVFLAGR